MVAVVVSMEEGLVAVSMAVVSTVAVFVVVVSDQEASVAVALPVAAPASARCRADKCSPTAEAGITAAGMDTTGTAIGITITDSLTMSFFSVTSDIQGGGAGTIHTDTDIMGTATRTATIRTVITPTTMDTADTGTTVTPATDTVTVTSAGFIRATVHFDRIACIKRTIHDIM